MNKSIRNLMAVSALIFILCCLFMSPRQTAASNLHKRSFASLGCMGDYDKAKFARLDRVCDECYQMFREPDVHSMCRWVNYSKTWRLKLEPDLIFVSNTSLLLTSIDVCRHPICVLRFLDFISIMPLTWHYSSSSWDEVIMIMMCVNSISFSLNSFSWPVSDSWHSFLLFIFNRQECFTNDVFTRCVDALLLMNEHPKLQAYISDLSVGKR